MQVEAEGRFWIIVKGKEPRKSVFSFYVDDDSSSWTRRTWDACKFRTCEQAQLALVELRRRVALRRRGRQDAS